MRVPAGRQMPDATVSVRIMDISDFDNLRYYQRLMAQIREAIEQDRFEAFVVEFYQKIGKEVPPLQLTQEK